MGNVIGKQDLKALWEKQDEKLKAILEKQDEKLESILQGQREDMAQLLKVLREDRAEAREVRQEDRAEAREVRQEDRAQLKKLEVILQGQREDTAQLLKVLREDRAEAREVRQEDSAQLKKLEVILQEGTAQLLKEQGETQEMIKYANGCYYRALSFIWYPESAKSFDGAANEWQKCRNKDDAAIKYYQNREQRKLDVRVCRGSFDIPNGYLFPVLNKSMAHLIPKDPSCSLAWLRALSIITGNAIEPKNSALFTKHLLTFVEGKAEDEGSKKGESSFNCDSSAVSYEDLPIVVEEKTPDQGSAQAGRNASNDSIPLKEWTWNFLMLPLDHEKHFDKIGWDKEPLMVATPIRDPSNEKDIWVPGTGYKLLIAASPKTYQWLMGTLRGNSKAWITTATPRELKNATAFLELTVKALADLLRINCEDDWGQYLDGKADNKRLEAIFEGISGEKAKGTLSQGSSTGSGGNNSTTKTINAKAFVAKIKTVSMMREKIINEGLQIPKLPEIISKQPVLVVDLGKFFQGNEHLIPDPFLVVLKAAVNWSTNHNQKLLPSCGNHSDHNQDIQNKKSIPAEIHTCAQSDNASLNSDSDDDSKVDDDVQRGDIYQTIASENLTGSPGDGIETMSSVSPSGEKSRRVVTP